MLRLVVTIAFIVSALAANFSHVDCFDVFGKSVGITLEGLQKTSLVEGMQFFDTATLPLTKFDIKSPDPQAPAAKYPIPAECFHKGKLDKNKEKTQFVLKNCQAGRSPADMMLICMTMCKQKSDCQGAVYSGHAANDGACQLYGGAALEWSRCSYYPYRYRCSKRVVDTYLGMFCPAKALPAFAYALKPATPVPANKPQVYYIGGKLSLTHAAFSAQSCQQLRTDGAWSKVLMSPSVFGSVGATRFRRVDCQREQKAGRLNLVYWLVCDSAIHDVTKLMQKIGSGACNEEKNPNSCAGSFWTSVVAPMFQAELSILNSVPKILIASKDTPHLKSENGAMIGEPTEARKCIDNGKLTGFKYAPDFAGMMFNDIETRPEQHAPIQPFYLSMRNPDAWYPIPIGCFNDFKFGTKSNPRIPEGGENYELLDKVIDGVHYDCLGNRTEEEMVRICVEICHMINFHQKDPSAEEYNCIAANYDEHGGVKGHCHLYQPQDDTVKAASSKACVNAAGIDNGGFCTKDKSKDLIEHAICGELDLDLQSCGRRNFLVIACHYDPVWCMNLGFGVTNGTRACTQCESGKHSQVGMRDWGIGTVKSVVPYPTQMSGKINYCIACKDGKNCEKGTGCTPAGFAAGTCPPGCPKGTFGIAGLCTVCVPGTFQDTAGQTACKECELGKFAVAPGNKECDLCPVGKQGTATGQKECDFCPQGKFSSKPGLANCTACPKSFITKLMGSLSSKDCLCEAGNYYPCLPSKSCSVNKTSQLGLQCEACPVGFTCNGESVAGIHVQPAVSVGKYTTKDKPYEAYECRAAGKLCLGGGSEQCGGGSAGLQCASCKEGQYLMPDGVCTPCEDGGSFVFAPLAIIFAVVVMCVLYKLNVKKGDKIESQRLEFQEQGDRKNDAAKQRAGGAAGNAGSAGGAAGNAAGSAGGNAGNAAAALSTPTVIATAPGASGIFAECMGVIISVLQLFAVVALFDIEWPKGFKDLMNALMIFLFDVDALRPSCFFGFGLPARYLPGVMVPPFFCLLMFSVWGGSVMANKVVPKIHRMDGDYVVSTMGTVLTALYIAVCKCIVNIFECRQNPSAPTTMSSHDGFMCLDPAIMGVLPVAILGVLVFTIGLPALLAWVLATGPKRYHVDQSFRKRFGFLVNKWNPRWYYWGLIVMLRNLMVSLIAVMTPDPLMQFVLLILFFSPVFALTLANAPWREEGLNFLDMFISATLLITVLLAVTLVPVPTGATKDMIGAFMVVVFVVGMCAAVAILLDVVNILFRGKTIFSRKPLDPAFQLAFIATMLKFEAMHQLGDEHMFADVARFFSELPMADGVRIANVMDVLDVGLFQEDMKGRGIAPNPPRTDARGQELKRCTSDKANAMKRASSKLMDNTSL